MSGLAICVADSDLDLRSFADPNVSRERLTYYRQNDRVYTGRSQATARPGNFTYPAFKPDDDDNDDSDFR